MIAFYAPLKSPNHTVPSGDRAIARAIQAALPNANLVSELRIYDPAGDLSVQQNLTVQAKAEAARLMDSTAEWRAWVTYHNYYKAPDLIGPAVANARGIPYVQIESTRARKRLDGPWACFAAAAEAASDAADAILYLTERDAEALRAYAPQDQRLAHLRPFLDYEALPPASTLSGPILAVGMMRHGDKMASYQLLAGTLTCLQSPEWRLDIAGDGPAKADVRALMAPFGARVRFLGQLDPAALSTAYRNASALLWPGVNEAFGLAYLEAQAHGVPVVAQDRPGVRDVVYSPLCDVAAGPPAMARQLDTLLTNSSIRRSMSLAVRDAVSNHHLRPAATQTLASVLSELGA